MFIIYFKMVPNYSFLVKRSMCKVNIFFRI